MPISGAPPSAGRGSSNPAAPLGQAGYLYEAATALVVAVVDGFVPPAPAGQVFVACADPSQVAVGGPAPRPALGNMTASDLELIRGIEDLVAAVDARDALLAKLVPGYAAPAWPSQLAAKIAARQALRAQAAPAATPAT